MTASHAQPLSDDARFELSLIAGAHERRNRPKHLTYLAGAVLVIALGTFWMSHRSLANARRGLTAARSQSAEVAATIARLEALRAQAQTTGAEAPEGPQSVRSAVQSAADQAGLKISTPGQSSKQPMGEKYTVQQFSYRDIKTPTIAPLLKWIEQSLNAVPGLQVSGFALRATPTGWSATVTFDRIETGSAG